MNSGEIMEALLDGADKQLPGKQILPGIFIHYLDAHGVNGSAPKSSENKQLIRSAK